MQSRKFWALDFVNAAMERTNSMLVVRLRIVRGTIDSVHLTDEFGIVYPIFSVWALFSEFIL
jgi:hypothetical protein